jgi:para-aminobenzoate synthetase/4-amino-4-deoxychorismate lyase
VASDVRVPALFEVERYPTVLQMTSTVTARARPGVTAADVLERLFPCGSITGAPKIRAQQVIAEVEDGPRGAYTGAIGGMTADGDARFNVSIRTLVWPAGATRARLGLGSGVVADSVAADEWRECLAKAAFLQRAPLPDLIETMRVESGAVPDLPLHLARMAASADFLGHRFDAGAARDAVLAAAAGWTGRLRLLLGPSGAIAVQQSALPPPITGAVTVALSPLPVPADDWRLFHKSSDRGFYDVARRASGAFEVLFHDPQGFLTEGSFTSLFVKEGDRLLTPPLARGLLPGVLRARLLAERRAVEADVSVADLRGRSFFIGNALRGLMPAVLAP